ncbi:MAG: protein rep [Saprospiraceae bacterium]|nr:protein rep [Candidatus Defluviibacterium haderslevense]
MPLVGNPKTLAKGQFNTLVQSGTDSNNYNPKPPLILQGEGAVKGDSISLKNRAKKKVITQSIILALVDIARRRIEVKREKAYWNTYHCQNRIIEVENRYYGDYCKNRFCTICAGIRKADIINRYYPVISKWSDPYFVTLTAKSVPAKTLNNRIDRMFLSLKKILTRNKKRHSRGKGIHLEGIRSLESNFNPIKRTYNPHFHLIVSSKEAAELIISEWLEQCTPAFAVSSAQNMRKVIDMNHDLVEIIKYGSKIFTDPTMKKKAQSKISPYIYVAAFHNIIGAMSGHRIFERFGFNLPERTKETKISLITDYNQLVFVPEQFDWVSTETAELLTGYQPSDELITILAENINLDLE